MKDSINIFERIIDTKIHRFINEFGVAKEVFFDIDGNPIHNGEYGTYRENVCKELIRTVIPMRLDIGSGFIINSDNKISHQCDLIIFDKNNTPLIETDDRQNFFPIETVVAVGEVKSSLKISGKSGIENALLKLKNIKTMSLTIGKDNPYIHGRPINSEYEPLKNPYDQIFTFLICNDFSFDYLDYLKTIDDNYSDCDKSLRHNLLLSIKDGIYMYDDNNGRPFHYPNIGDIVLKHKFLMPCTEGVNIVGVDTTFNKNEHIIAFLNCLYMATSSGSVLYPEMTTYLGRNRQKLTYRSTSDKNGV